MPLRYRRRYRTTIDPDECLAVIRSIAGTSVDSTPGRDVLAIGLADGGEFSAWIGRGGHPPTSSFPPMSLVTGRIWRDDDWTVIEFRRASVFYLFLAAALVAFSVGLIVVRAFLSPNGRADGFGAAVPSFSSAPSLSALLALLILPIVVLTMIGCWGVIEAPAEAAIVRHLGAVPTGERSPAAANIGRLTVNRRKKRQRSPARGR